MQTHSDQRRVARESTSRRARAWSDDGAERRSGHGGCGSTVVRSTAGSSPEARSVPGVAGTVVSSEGRELSWPWPIVTDDVSSGGGRAAADHDRVRVFVGADANTPFCRPSASRERDPRSQACPAGTARCARVPVSCRCCFGVSCHVQSVADRHPRSFRRRCARRPYGGGMYGEWSEEHQRIRGAIEALHRRGDRADPRRTATTATLHATRVRRKLYAIVRGSDADAEVSFG